MEQSIQTNVQAGQSTLPSSCPVCEHTPVSAEDCKPNKALRSTIKIFLRTEEKKREALRQKDLKATPPATPLETESTPLEPANSTEHAVVTETAVEASDDTPIPAEASTDEPAQEVSSAEPVDGEEADQAEEDIPQPSIEVRIHYGTQVYATQC
jgi:hypothetical protein